MRKNRTGEAERKIGKAGNWESGKRRKAGNGKEETWGKKKAESGSLEPLIRRIAESRPLPAVSPKPKAFSLALRA